MSTIRILDWRPMQKGALLGFAKIELPSGMIIVDCTICTGPNGPWASPPSKAMIGRDGLVMKDQADKVRYQPLIEFTSKDVRNRWSDAVLQAVREAHPDVFK